VLEIEWLKLPIVVHLRNMTTIKILAVEDDPIYAASLEMIVDELGYELIDIVDSAADAISSIKKTMPDLILMDIEINDKMSGIELSARLKSICQAPVIFVTSHKDRETFQKAKLTLPEAYIIKPYNKESLEAAIELALMKIDFSEPLKQQQESGSEGFYIKDNGSLYKIIPADILYVEADEKYCTIYTKQRKHTINIRLKEIYERLSSCDFIQTHRAFIVRKEAIEKICTAEQTLLVGGKEIPMGKSFREELMAKLNYF
jgi:DNA-binding LytR/AlgR family response regulator